MTFSAKRFWIVGVLFCAAVVLWTVGAADAQAPKSPPAEPVPEKPDPFAVPDGTAAELLAYIERLQGLQPPSSDGQAERAFRRQQFGATVKAATKILLGKPAPAAAAAAARWKLEALFSLRELGDPGVGQRLEAFPAELARMGHKTLARLVRGALLHDRLNQAMTARREDLDKLLGEIKRFVGEAPPAGNELGLAMATAQVLEMTGNADLAADAYRTFGQAFAASKNQQIAAFGVKMTGAARRLTLEGKPMPLKGTYLDGKPFAWADYQGKVVLVQFWATWCGPCRREIVNIRQNYELYHDRGFEVIGVNCDDDRRQLETFLKQNPLPWKNLFSDDPGAAGMDNPMAVYYGVMGIPQLVLVGPDGKVVSLEVRGAKLGQQLTRLLGPAEAKPQKPDAPGGTVGR